VLVVFKQELFCPPERSYKKFETNERLMLPFTSSRISEIDICRVAGPAPSVEFASARLLYINICLFRATVDVVVIVDLDVRVDNCHHLAPLRCDVLDHFIWRWKFDRIPREVALSVGVLDVEPDDIGRNVVNVEVCVDFGNIGLVPLIRVTIFSIGPQISLFGDINFSRFYPTFSPILSQILPIFDESDPIYPRC
jgi:hypothetical protein